MEIIIRGKNMEVTEALRDYITKRIGKLERYLNHIATATVVLGVQRGRHIVEVTIPLDGGIILRGEEETNDMYASVDAVIEKLERQIERYKTKLDKRAKGQGRRSLLLAPEREPLVPEEEIQVVRVKRFPLKPMPVEEAIMQMNLVGHSFFVFTNAENEKVSVVYRRRDGKYGLIEPEY